MLSRRALLCLTPALALQAPSARRLTTMSAAPYTLYDLTSSGLNQSPGRTWYTSVNSYRLPGKVYPGRNFGLIQIDWAGKDTTITLQGRKESGEVVHEEIIPLSRLRMAGQSGQ